MNSKILIAFVLSLTVVSVAPAAETPKGDFCVAPAGNDAHPGTADRPFATLARARDAVRELKKGGQQKNITVLIRGGTYRLKEPLVFGPEDSGTPQGRVIYAAAAGETPVLTGGQPIAGWRKLTEDVPGIPPEAKGKLWVADVPKGWRFHYLFVDGARQQRAIRPNTDDWGAWPKIVGAGQREPGGQRITFPAGALAGVPTNGDAEMCFIPTWRWMNEIPVLRDVDAAQNTARRCSKNVTYAGKSGDPFRLENVLPALDQPGEWCVDSAAGRAYYWPPKEDMTGVTVEAPALCNLVRFQGKEEDGPWVHHIEMRGLTFRCSDRLPEDEWPDAWLKRFENPDAMVFLQGVEDCVLEGNRFLDAGTYAVALDHHAQRCRVVGNEMANLGCGGVQLYGYGPGGPAANRENVVSRNYIHHIGLAPYWHSSAITLYGSETNRIDFNYIHDVPYCGVVIAGAYSDDLNKASRTECDSFGRRGAGGAGYNIRWAGLPEGSRERYEADKGTFTRQSVKPLQRSGDNRVERNIIVDVMQKLHDGGALYCWSCGLNNIWRRNVVHNTRDTHQFYVLYMDDEVDGALVEGNVVWVPHGRVHNKGGNTWRLNEVSSQRTTAYDRVLKEILQAVKKQGGWTGTPKPLDVREVVEPKPVPVPDGWIPAKAAYELGGVQLDDQGNIGWCDGGDYVAFGPYEFGEGKLGALELMVGVDPKYANQKMDVRLDDALDGPSIGTMVFQSTGGFQEFKSQRIELTGLKGTHMVFFVFEGKQGICSIQKIRFAASATQQTGKAE